MGVVPEPDPNRGTPDSAGGTRSPPSGIASARVVDAEPLASEGSTNVAYRLRTKRGPPAGPARHGPHVSDAILQLAGMEVRMAPVILQACLFAVSSWTTARRF